MIRYYLAVFAQIANLVGTATIFFALSFTSIGFRAAVEPTLGRTELCFGGVAFIDSVGHLMSAPCPENSTGQIAIVNSFHPTMALVGLGLVVFGSLFALLTIQKPKV
ncbi:MAG: hypothetical protein ACREQR_12215 [Candidatus Binataceae bacterium]